MRSIGIPVADRDECALALETAFTLGKSLHADVIGLHVRPLPDLDGNISLSDVWAGAGMAYGDWYQQDEQESKAAAASARRLFERMAESLGYPLSSEHGTRQAPVAIFRDQRGEPDKQLAAFGPVNDLLVLSRPAKKGGNKAFLIMMGALMDSVTPVLLLPQRGAQVSGKRLAVAWNGGRTEALLVHACLPLLAAAEDVVFITAGEDGKRGPSAQDMIRYLSAHGIKARFRQAGDGNAGKAIERTAAEENAEVLLCGAYTRGRMREMVFGGVTEYLITESEFPVIMMHI